MELTVRTTSGERRVAVAPHTTGAQLKQQVADLLPLGLPGRLVSDMEAAEVHKGELVSDGALLHDLCCDGSSLVLLPSRAVPPKPALVTAPTPTSTQIDAAIREEVQRSPNPGDLDDAAQRQRARLAQRAQQQQEFQALEDALAEGDLGALREYLDQLQQALSAGARAVDAGAGAAGAGPAAGGAGGGGAPLQVPALLQNLLGPLAQGPLAQAAAALAEAAHETGEEEEEEDGEGEFTEEEDDYITEEDWDEEDEEEGLEEEAEGEGGPAGLPPPRVPEVSREGLASLQEMGFSEQLCRNALLLHRNHLERALEWLIENAAHPAAAEPLSDARLAQIYGRGPRRQGPPVDQARLVQLVDMGFDMGQAEEALRTFNNSLEAACQYLLTQAAAAAREGPPSASSSEGGVESGAGSEDEASTESESEGEGGGGSEGGSRGEGELPELESEASGSTAWEDEGAEAGAEEGEGGALYSGWQDRSSGAAELGAGSSAGGSAAGQAHCSEVEAGAAGSGQPSEGSEACSSPVAPGAAEGTSASAAAAGEREAGAAAAAPDSPGSEASEAAGWATNSTGRQVASDTGSGPGAPGPSAEAPGPAAGAAEQ